MPITLEQSVIDAVKEKNKGWPQNHDYKIIKDDDIIGSYVIYTVEFYGSDNEWYQNFCVTKKSKIVGVFYFLQDVIHFLDRSFSWKAFFIDQYGVVAGSIVIVLVLGFGAAFLIEGKDVPQQLWVLISTAIGYLFGAKGTAKKRGS